MRSHHSTMVGTPGVGGGGGEDETAGGGKRKFGGRLGISCRLLAGTRRPEGCKGPSAKPTREHCPPTPHPCPPKDLDEASMTKENTDSEAGAMRRSGQLRRIELQRGFGMGGRLVGRLSQNLRHGRGMGRLGKWWESLNSWRAVLFGRSVAGRGLPQKLSQCVGWYFRVCALV